MNQADTAWMLISTALVLLMTPALALLLRRAGALEERAQHHDDEFHLARIRGWRGPCSATRSRSPRGNNWLGDLSNGFLNGVGLEAQGTIPHALFMAFQGTFCIITAALISGAIVERMRFSAYVAFISLWALVVYSPIAHWVWGGGWLADMGALDFAGGTVVHVNAAVAALVAAIVVGKRQGIDRRRSSRTTCRSCSSAPACCGSAGSGSTRAARWPPARLPAWPSSRRCWLRRRRWWSGPFST